MKHLGIITLALCLFACGPEEVTDIVTDDDRELLPDPEGLAHDTFPTEDVDSAESDISQIERMVYALLGKKGFDNEMMFFQVLDPQNGYASVTGAFEGWMEFTYWNRADGTMLLAETAAGCGPVCDQSLYFYSFSKGSDEFTQLELEDVIPTTEIDSHVELMADRGFEQFEMEGDDFFPWYTLPQEGTSILIEMDMDLNEIVFPIMELSWNKERFEVSKYIYEIELSEPYH